MSLTLPYFALTLSFSKITHNIEFCKFDCCINKCKKRVVEIIRKKSKRSKFKLKNSRKKGKNNNKASQTSKNVKGGNLAGTPRQDKTKLRRVNQYPFTKQFDSIRRNLRQNRNVLFAKMSITVLQFFLQVKVFLLRTVCFVHFKFWPFCWCTLTI